MRFEQVVDVERHPVASVDYYEQARAALDESGALLLRGFLRPAAIEALVAEAEGLRQLAYYSEQTHTVYLDQPDSALPATDARSRAIVSTKGAVTTDLVPAASGLHTIYDSPMFREFLCHALGEAELHAYADPLSSINVNYYDAGQELGWHFDNSSFSVTLLLQEPEAGGVFEYIDRMRDAEAGEQNEEAVAQSLDGHGDRPSTTLEQRPGDLALFRGRNALHRVSPVQGRRSRILVVLAYNTEPGMSLSENARLTFFGRLN